MSTSSETMEDDRVVAKCYVELGNVTKEKGEYDESLRYHRKSLEIFERIDDALSVADSHLNIAEIYKAKGEFKQAMTEYEKGLTMYEDVYVEDANKSSDSGTDVSLNSSSFSDLQHAKLISKSYETLPQTKLINSIEESISHSPLQLVEDVINTSNMNVDDVSLPPSPVDFFSQTTAETISDESDIFEIDLPTSWELAAEPSSLDNNNNHTQPPDAEKDRIVTDQKQMNKTFRLWHYSPNKPFLIIILSIFLISAVYWSLNDIAIQSELSCSSTDSVEHENSLIHDSDDLTEQLRKLLIWRKDRLTSLKKDNLQMIEEFLTNSDSRMEITLDKFQQILDLLNLKIVLIPQ